MLRSAAALLPLLCLKRAGLSLARSAEAAAGPNFVFVLADDWGWGDVGFTGSNAVIHTPNLDSIATHGITFTDFHTASPVCSPSRTGFMTGRAPARFSIHTALNVHWSANAAEGQANFLPPSVPTVTKLLQDAGWRTGHFGKWHLGSGNNNGTGRAPVPTAYGIDQSCTFNSNDPCQADAHTGNTSVNIVDSALGFIAQSAADKARFYCNVWLHVSHNKLDPTAEQKAAVPAKSTQCKAGELATNQTECAQLVFVAAQQDADAQIGRLWKLLGDLDLIESTLLLFSTDNGPEEQRVYSNAQGSQGPFRGRKRSLYEGGHRVPSFAVWGGKTPKPTILAGIVDHTPISALDWFPTVLALAKVPISPALKATLDGEDISRVLLDSRTGVRPPTARKTKMFWEWRYGVSGPCENAAPDLAVRDGDWKYLENADGSRRELYKLDLYNLTKPSTQSDFHEMNNLVDAEPERATELAYALHSWLHSLPDGPAWLSTQGCQGFRFPERDLGADKRTDLQGFEKVEGEAQDSAPDW